MTIVDNYFPFDSGAGAVATAARWRLMARLWSSTGVIPLFLNSLAPTIAGSVVTIAPGAVWIDGYYGESDSPKTLSVSGNGMVVARMDPTAREILFVFVPNQTTPTRDQNGIYEVPLMQITGGSTGTDIRLFAVEAATAVPTGTIFDYAGATIPSGWLLCDGSLVSRTTYAALYGILGGAWGANDGSTNFKLPDMRGRTTFGTGLVGSNAQPGLILTGTGGEQNHTLTDAELAAHNHTGGTGPMNQNQSHYHSIPGYEFLIGTVGAGPYGTPNNPPYASYTPNTSTVNTDHAHTVSSDGGNSPHNNMPPFIVVNKMIKT